MVKKGAGETPRVRGSKKNHRKKTSTKSSDDDSFSDPPEEKVADDNSFNLKQGSTEQFVGMSEVEMSQHMKLCMKLAVENKINAKNAFGLHLIDILQNIIKKNKTVDIQQASLSLQASSKIYAGRVDALYQDTFKFHKQLHSIVMGDKKGLDKKDQAQSEDFDEVMDDDDDNLHKTKPKSQKNKCKLHLKSEESLKIEKDAMSSNSKVPHGNFVLINSAFNTARTSPMLLSSLQFVNDSCMLKCAVSESCFKEKSASNSVQYNIGHKLENFIEKIKNFSCTNSDFQNFEAEVIPFSNSMSTPKSASTSVFFQDADQNCDTSFNDFNDHGSDEPAEEDVLQSTINKLDILNITAHAFVNEISSAVIGGVVDQSLLPPGSAIKKMLEKSTKKSSSRPPTLGLTTKKKAKEPFFLGKSAKDCAHLFVLGKRTKLPKSTLDQWDVEQTVDVDLGYNLIEDLDDKIEECLGASALRSLKLEQILDTIKQNDLQFHYKYYFNKYSQLWKVFKRKLVLEQSGYSNAGGNQTEKGRFGSITPTDPERLAMSFHNLSLQDIPEEDCHNATDISTGSVDNPLPETEVNNDGLDISLNGAVDLNDDPCEEPEFLIPHERSELDIEEMMVKPPELVKPCLIKYEKKCVDVDTDYLKSILWKIISKHFQNSCENPPCILFTELYEKLKKDLKKEISDSLSMPMAFTVLLLLAVEKTLWIENMNESSNLVIKQDICEIEVSKSGEPYH